MIEPGTSLTGWLMLCAVSAYDSWRRRRYLRNIETDIGDIRETLERIRDLLSHR